MQLQLAFQMKYLVDWGRVFPCKILKCACDECLREEEAANPIDRRRGALIHPVSQEGQAV